MNQKDNELYKAGQFTEWQKYVEEEIKNLNKKLDIILFLSVWNDFEKILNNNHENHLYRQKLCRPRQRIRKRNS